MRFSYTYIKLCQLMWLIAAVAKTEQTDWPSSIRIAYVQMAELRREKHLFIVNL